jgi:hypothetical protein
MVLLAQEPTHKMRRYSVSVRHADYVHYVIHPCSRICVNLLAARSRWYPIRAAHGMPSPIALCQLYKRISLHCL